MAAGNSTLGTEAIQQLLVDSIPLRAGSVIFLARDTSAGHYESARRLKNSFTLIEMSEGTI